MSDISTNRDVVPEDDGLPSPRTLSRIEDVITMQDASPLDYRDSWPTCEVTIEVLNAERFSLAEGTFEATIDVRLDWLDWQLKENVHFFENQRLGRFEYAATVMMDVDAFFNPEIFLENQDLSGLPTDHYGGGWSAGGNANGYGGNASSMGGINGGGNGIQGGGMGSIAGGSRGISNGGVGVAMGSGGSGEGIRDGKVYLSGVGVKNEQDRIPTIVDPGVRVPRELWNHFQPTGGAGGFSARDRIRSGRGFRHGTVMGGGSCGGGRRGHHEHQDPVWLTKWFRFRGQFNCLDANAVCFPLDIQKLPFIIRAKPLSNRDGIRRELVLKDPLIRRIWRHAQRTSLVSAMQWHEEKLEGEFKGFGDRSGSFIDMGMDGCGSGGRGGSAERGFGERGSGALAASSSRVFRSSVTASGGASGIFSSSSFRNGTSMGKADIATMMNPKMNPNSSLRSLQAANSTFQAKRPSSDELLRVENLAALAQPCSNYGTKGNIGRALSEYARLPNVGQVLLDTPPHLWSVKAGLPDLITNKRKTLTVIGENQVLGFGGVARSGGSGSVETGNSSSGQTYGQSYEGVIVIMRNWRQYRFDYLIQVAQVVSAAASFYVPFSEEMLAQRLSITLAILLTLTLFTKERPPVIEEIPYSTIHDEFQQFMVVVTVFIGIENLGVFAKCFGVFGPNLVFDIDLASNTLQERDPELWYEWCEESFLGTSQMDTLCFLLTLSVLFFLTVHTAARIQLLRLQEYLELQNFFKGRGLRVFLGEKASEKMGMVCGGWRYSDWEKKQVVLGGLEKRVVAGLATGRGGSSGRGGPSGGGAHDEIPAAAQNAVLEISYNILPWDGGEFGVEIDRSCGNLIVREVTVGSKTDDAGVRPGFSLCGYYTNSGYREIIPSFFCLETLCKETSEHFKASHSRPDRRRIRLLFCCPDTFCVVPETERQTLRLLEIFPGSDVFHTFWLWWTRRGEVSVLVFLILTMIACGMIMVGSSWRILEGYVFWPAARFVERWRLSCQKIVWWWNNDTDGLWGVGDEDEEDINDGVVNGDDNNEKRGGCMRWLKKWCGCGGWLDQLQSWEFANGSHRHHGNNSRRKDQEEDNKDNKDNKKPLSTSQSSVFRRGTTGFFRRGSSLRSDNGDLRGNLREVEVRNSALQKQLGARNYTIWPGFRGGSHHQYKNGKLSRSFLNNFTNVDLVDGQPLFFVDISNGLVQFHVFYWKYKNCIENARVVEGSGGSVEGCKEKNEDEIIDPEKPTLFIEPTKLLRERERAARARAANEARRRHAYAQLMHEGLKSKQKTLVHRVFAEIPVHESGFFHHFVLDRSSRSRGVLGGGLSGGQQGNFVKKYEIFADVLMEKFSQEFFRWWKEDQRERLKLSGEAAARVAEMKMRMEVAGVTTEMKMRKDENTTIQSEGGFGETGKINDVSPIPANNPSVAVTPATPQLPSPTSDLSAATRMSKQSNSTLAVSSLANFLPGRAKKNKMKFAAVNEKNSRELNNSKTNTSIRNTNLLAAAVATTGATSSTSSVSMGGNGNEDNTKKLHGSLGGGAKERANLCKKLAEKERERRKSLAEKRKGGVDGIGMGQLPGIHDYIPPPCKRFHVILGFSNLASIKHNDREIDTAKLLYYLNRWRTRVELCLNDKLNTWLEDNGSKEQPDVWVCKNPGYKSFLIEEGGVLKGGKQGCSGGGSGSLGGVLGFHRTGSLASTSSASLNSIGRSSNGLSSGGSSSSSENDTSSSSSSNSSSSSSDSSSSSSSTSDSSSSDGDDDEQDESGQENISGRKTSRSVPLSTSASSSGSMLKRAMRHLSFSESSRPENEMVGVVVGSGNSTTQTNERKGSSHPSTTDETGTGSQSLSTAANSYESGNSRRTLLNAAKNPRPVAVNPNEKMKQTFQNKHVRNTVVANNFVTYAQEKVLETGAADGLAKVKLHVFSLTRDEDARYSLNAVDWLVKFGDLSVVREDAAAVDKVDPKDGKDDNESNVACKSNVACSKSDVSSNRHRSENSAVVRSPVPEDFARLELANAFQCSVASTQYGSVSGELDLSSFVTEFSDLRVSGARLRDLFIKTEREFNTSINKKSDRNVVKRGNANGGNANVLVKNGSNILPKRRALFMQTRSFEQSMRDAFRKDDLLMRYFVRSRILVGSLCANDHWSAIALKRGSSVCGGRPAVHSVPVGHLTPGKTKSLWGETQTTISIGGSRSGGAVLSMKDVDKWRSHIVKCIRQRSVPCVRGLVIGLSTRGSVFEEICEIVKFEGVVMTRDVFLVEIEKALWGRGDVIVSSPLMTRNDNGHWGQISSDVNSRQKGSCYGLWSKKTSLRKAVLMEEARRDVLQMRIGKMEISIAEVVEKKEQRLAKKRERKESRRRSRESEGGSSSSKLGEGHQGHQNDSPNHASPDSARKTLMPRALQNVSNNLSTMFSSVVPNTSMRSFAPLKTNSSAAKDIIPVASPRGATLLVPSPRKNLSPRKSRNISNATSVTNSQAFSTPLKSPRGTGSTKSPRKITGGQQDRPRRSFANKKKQDHTSVDEDEKNEHVKGTSTTAELEKQEQSLRRSLDELRKEHKSAVTDLTTARRNEEKWTRQISSLLLGQVLVQECLHPLSFICCKAVWRGVGSGGVVGSSARGVGDRQDQDNKGSDKNKMIDRRDEGAGDSGTVVEEHRSGSCVGSSEEQSVEKDGSCVNSSRVEMGERTELSDGILHDGVQRQEEISQEYTANWALGCFLTYGGGS